MIFQAKLFGKIFANSCMKMIQIGPREAEKTFEFYKICQINFYFSKNYHQE